MTCRPAPLLLLAALIPLALSRPVATRSWAEEARPATRPTSQPSADLLGNLHRRPPEVRIEGVALTDVLDFCTDVMGVKVTGDWNALAAAGVSKEKPITLRLRDKPNAEWLTTLAGIAGGTMPLAFVEMRLPEREIGSERGGGPALVLSTLKAIEARGQSPLDLTNLPPAPPLPSGGTTRPATWHDQ